MADYRRELAKNDYKHLLDKYERHKDADGGIFTPHTRRRLLGVKGTMDKTRSPDTADFWYDVRKTVRNGLKDLELICEVAHPEQLEEIFRDTLSNEEAKEIQKLTPEKSDLFLESLPSIFRTLTALFKDYLIYKKVKNPYNDSMYTQTKNIEKSDAWRAHLANQMIKICLEFYKQHRLVTSKAHVRLVEEIEDMLDVELGNAYMLPRDRRNVRFV